MENWKRFLKEEEEESGFSEKQFSGKPEELECIKNLREQLAELTPKEDRPVGGGPLARAAAKPVSLWTRKTLERHDTLIKCMEKAGYTQPGSGGFRLVFNVPGRPDRVIKIAYHDVKRSLEMNRKEAEGGFQTSSPLAPKVFDSAKDFLWIESEKITPIENWLELQGFSIVWKELLHKIKRPHMHSGNFSDIFRMLISKKAPFREDAIRNKVVTFLKKSEEGIELIYKGEDEAITDNLINDPLIVGIRDFLIQHNLPSWDIRPKNVGYVFRDGKKQFVILDPGFELRPGVGYN